MGLPPPLSMLWRWRPGVRTDSERCGGVPCEHLRWRDATGPVLLYFHGGGYVSCSPKTHRPNTVTLSRLLRAETYVPDYRLAPEHPFPAAVEDALAVYRTICAGSDVRWIILAGDSAGGGLAIATAIGARDNGLRLPSAILTFSPWVDLTPGREPELREREHLCDMFYAESFAAYADAYLQGAHPRAPLVSPLFASLESSTVAD